MEGVTKETMEKYLTKISTFLLSLRNNAFLSSRVERVCVLILLCFQMLNCIRAINLVILFGILAITGSASGLSYYICEKTHP